MSTHATFALAPAWPVFVVEGSDAASWLNGLVTCDTTTVTESRGAWGLLLTKPGKIQAELQITGRRDRLTVGLSGGNLEQVVAHLERYLVMEDAEVRVAPELRFVSLYGARAFTEAHAVSSRVSEMPWGTGAAAWVGTPEELSVFLESLRAAGIEVAPSDAEERRVALGIPHYGVDFGERDNPHEAALDRRAVNWSKGCYLGQEVVCMQDMRGKVKRRLVRLVADQFSAQPGDPVLTDASVEVGRVTSIGRGQVIASVNAPWFEPGKELVVSQHSVRVNALDSE